MKAGVLKTLINRSDIALVVLLKDGRYPKNRGDCQFIIPGENMFFVSFIN